jgi:hypothetical protein
VGCQIAELRAGFGRHEGEERDELGAAGEDAATDAIEGGGGEGRRPPDEEAAGSTPAPCSLTSRRLKNLVRNKEPVGLG